MRGRMLEHRVDGRIVSHVGRYAAEAVAMEAYLETVELRSTEPDIWHDWAVRPDLNEALLCALEREHKEEWC